MASTVTTTSVAGPLHYIRVKYRKTTIFLPCELSDTVPVIMQRIEALLAQHNPSADRFSVNDCMRLFMPESNEKPVKSLTLTASFNIPAGYRCLDAGSMTDVTLKSVEGLVNGSILFLQTRPQAGN
jgi:hypothetical protein